MPADPRDYKLDISGLTNAGPDDASAARTSSGARPFISVQFACCSVYLRVYRNATGDAYEARCPKCLRSVRFPIGPGGSDARSFVVS